MQIFVKSRENLKILGAKQVTSSKLHSWGSTSSRCYGYRRLRFVHPWCQSVPRRVRLGVPIRSCAVIMVQDGRTGGLVQATLVLPPRKMSPLCTRKESGWAAATVRKSMPPVTILTPVDRSSNHSVVTMLTELPLPQSAVHNKCHTPVTVSSSP
jgi:hypothetical protein